jgi:hypothetical protein
MVLGSWKNAMKKCECVKANLFSLGVAQTASTTHDTPTNQLLSTRIRGTIAESCFPLQMRTARTLTDGNQEDLACFFYRDLPIGITKGRQIHTHFDQRANNVPFGCLDLTDIDRSRHTLARHDKNFLPSCLPPCMPPLWSTHLSKYARL